MDTAEQNGTPPPQIPRPFTARQEKLLAALVTNPDVQAACKTAGVGRTTAYRWLRDPAFRDALARERGALLTDALSAVKAHVTLAVSQLAKLLRSKDDRLRRMACNDILGHALKVRELEEIEERLAALEAALEERGGRL